MPDIFEIAKKAAFAGGEIVSDYYENGVEMRCKQSFDLVSDADLDSEKKIVEIIKEAFPDHSIIAEEAQKDSMDAEHLWVVDPLDGTNNFAHHIPHFAVSIGYYINGEAQCGVVYNPIHKDLYTSVKGGGAFYNDKPAAVSNAATMEEALIGTGFYYDRGQMMKDTLKRVEKLFEMNVHGIRRHGTASLDLCYIGCGMFDAYFEYKLAPWDYAAGVLFVEEAGGKVTDCQGNKLGLRHTSILASNSKLHGVVQEVVNSDY